MHIVAIVAPPRSAVSPLKEVGAVAAKTDSRAAASDPRKEMAEFLTPHPQSPALNGDAPPAASLSSGCCARPRVRSEARTLPLIPKT
ncbi:hypothetical protein [Chromobacterium sp. Beijing]|uniref:hypothetical protein n=1 Tax=Chromobacterium sp. Beijing TaxID=2735795 RepID=UPI001F2CD65B|nr:hypothetical protein [Chromobacterium sp. Beijing]UJB32087.1 hypothetical protein HQN78_14050 [Chromobacterium sp. Beijing]